MDNKFFETISVGEEVCSVDVRCGGRIIDIWIIDKITKMGRIKAHKKGLETEVQFDQSGYKRGTDNWSLDSIQLQKFTDVLKTERKCHILRHNCLNLNLEIGSTIKNGIFSLEKSLEIYDLLLKLKETVK